MKFLISNQIFQRTYFVSINISDDDLYGSAPWMGTLRHVTHENMVAKTIKPTPKFKKYPDEDAPNPFKGMQGKFKPQ